MTCLLWWHNSYSKCTLIPHAMNIITNCTPALSSVLYRYSWSMSRYRRRHNNPPPMYTAIHLALTGACDWDVIWFCRIEIAKCLHAKQGHEESLHIDLQDIPAQIWHCQAVWYSTWGSTRMAISKQGVDHRVKSYACWHKQHHICLCYKPGTPTWPPSGGDISYMLQSSPLRNTLQTTDPHSDNVM